MKKMKTVTKDQSTGIAELLGMLMIGFAMIDFALSWMGINLTGFMGPASRFSPIIFGVIGSVLMNLKKEGG